ncbi:MAG: hypothetical protein Q7V57_09070 [Actinomycetota bacterium]|nr:hypothetical protein [Actinomycetota bacterium]
MERLRHLARADGVDPLALVRETASALRGLGDDPAGLVVACRRIVERHPTSGPLWWLCSHVVTAAEPYKVARRLADDLANDPTAEALSSLLAANARVCTLGWPDIAGDTIIRRGDVAALVVDTTDDADAFVRRLGRAGVTAELVAASALTAAVLVADVVVIEALAASGEEFFAPLGSRAAASLAYCSGVPVVAVVGRGRRLPARTYESMIDRITDVEAPWHAMAEIVPVGLCSHVAGPLGLQHSADSHFAAECPMAPELLTVSPN